MSTASSAGNQSPPEHRNIVDLQRAIAIKRLDEQMAEDWANDYGVDVDAALDRRHQLSQAIQQGII